MFKKLSCVFLLLIGLFACKTEPQNSEPKFIVKFYSKETGRGSNYCFDKIYGLNRSDLPVVCMDSTRNYLEFPLDIKNDSVVYIFQKKDQYDTIIIKYSPKIDSDGGKYVVNPGPLIVAKHSFDSLQVQCKFENKPFCETENIYIFL